MSVGPIHDTQRTLKQSALIYVIINNVIRHYIYIIYNKYYVLHYINIIYNKIYIFKYIYLNIYIYLF